MANMFGEPVTLGLAATRKSDGVIAQIDVDVAPGYYVYPPSSQEGIPVSVKLPDGSAFELKSSPEFPESSDGHLYGHFNIEIPLKGKGEELELIVGYQACDVQMCLMPATETLRCKVS